MSIVRTTWVGGAMCVRVPCQWRGNAAPRIVRCCMLCYKAAGKLPIAPTLCAPRRRPTTPLQGKAVLRKEPMSRDVRAGDVFSVNDAFTSKLYKVKIGMVTAQVQYTQHKGGTVGCSWQRDNGQ